MARKHRKSQLNFLSKPVTENQMTEPVRANVCRFRERLPSDIQHSFPGPNLKTRSRAKSHKTNCHLTVQKFPFNFKGIFKLCGFPLMKKSACHWSLLWELKYIKNLLQSYNLGICSWQTYYESDRAYSIHLFVIKTFQIWPWLLSISIFNQCNREARITIL